MGLLLQWIEWPAPSNSCIRYFGVKPHICNEQYTVIQNMSLQCQTKSQLIHFVFVGKEPGIGNEEVGQWWFVRGLPWPC